MELHRNQPTPEDNLRLRQQIDYLLDQYDFDAIGNLPDFRIIERNKDRPAGEDCSVYVFHTFQPVKELQRVERDYSEVVTPQEGDIVIYYEDDESYAHVAIATDHEKVRSKFGDKAHVYEHPREAVPTYYGNRIRIFRASEAQPIEPEPALRIRLLRSVRRALALLR